MKIAVIGSGVSGMAAAWKLAKNHEVTVFEKNDYIGGHSNTVDAKFDDGTVIPVDTGFIVFNKRNYVNMVPAFDELKVPYEESDMSFAFSLENGKFEYSAAKLFAQKSNLFNFAYWKMLVEILRFNKRSIKILETNRRISLGGYLNELNVSKNFMDWFILPMGSAIWSAPNEQILEFPALSFIRFFSNHGLLTVNDQPQWYTVSGGSREYVKRITASYAKNIRLNTPIKSIRRESGGVIVDGETFDRAVIAVHGYHALQLLDNPTAAEEKLLPKFRYQPNRVFLHQDESLMPRRKKAWSAWNYLVDADGNTCCTYWMNKLQNIDEAYPLFVTTNPYYEPQRIIKVIDYEHPIFDTEAVEAQGKISEIQGKDKIWYCGAYMRYGFHEDGFTAGINAAEDLLGKQ